MLESITKDISLKIISIKCGSFVWCSIMLHQIKAPQFYTTTTTTNNNNNRLYLKRVTHLVTKLIFHEAL